jgi:hypothetical protein
MCICAHFKDNLTATENSTSWYWYSNCISCMKLSIKCRAKVFAHLLYIICKICNKCICSINTGSQISYTQWRNSYSCFFHLGIISILVLEFYSGLSGRVRTVYLFSLCVVSLLSSRFTVSALVWFSDFLKYVAFHFYISLSIAFIFRSSWILWLFMYQGAFRMSRSLGLKALGNFVLESKAVTPSLIQAKFEEIISVFVSHGPPLWSSGQSSWLQFWRSR